MHKTAHGAGARRADISPVDCACAVGLRSRDYEFEKRDFIVYDKIFGREVKESG